MATNVTIPNLGDSISQVTILRWLKNEGEFVRVDDSLMELETDKANTDLPAQVAGVLRQTRKAGETVNIGDVVGTIDPNAAADKASASAAVGKVAASSGVDRASATSVGEKVPASSAPTSTTPSATPSATTAATDQSGAPSAAGHPPAVATGGPPLSPHVAATTVGAGASALTADQLQDLNPSVRPLILEHRLNPGDIPGTGPRGRLLKEDVLKYLEKSGKNGKAGQGDGSFWVGGASADAASDAAARMATPISETPGAPSTVPPASAAAPASAGGTVVAKAAAPGDKPGPAEPGAARSPALPGDKPAPGDFDASGAARVAMSKIRKRTALNLKQAQNTAAILTTFNEVDMSGIIDLRSRLKEKFEKTHGVGLGFMSFFSRAIILGLREFSKINAFIDGDDIVYHNHVNLGIAVSSDRGLVVPVLKHAELMSFAKIESEIKRLALAVRDNKIALNELTGGTFTVTNGGVFGSLLSTPIINPPQSGILGMHAINKRPVAINDKVEIRPMMYIALSYDHRIVDGRDSVSFLMRLKEYLEDPARLMLEV